MKKFFTLALMCVVCLFAKADYTDISSASDIIYFQDTKLVPGMTADINILVKSTKNIGSAQLKYTMPDGVTINKIKGIGTTTERATENDYSVLQGLDEVSPVDGYKTVGTLNVTVSSDMKVGDFEMTVTDFKLANADDTSEKIAGNNIVTKLTVVDYSEGYSIKMDDFRLYPEGVDGLEFVLGTQKALTNISFDVEFPECIGTNQLYTVSKALGTTTATTSITDDENGNVNVEITHKGTKTIADKSTVAKLEIDYDEELVKEGQYQMFIKNIKMTDADGNVYYAAPTTTTITVGNQAKELTLSETSSEAITDGEYTKVTVTRSMAQGVWNTLVLPFAMTADQIAANKIAKVAALTGATDDGQTYNLTFSEATTIEAGQPYMVQPASNYTGSIVVEDATNKIAVSTATCSQTQGNVTFQGTFAPIASVPYNKTSPNTFVVSNNKFYPVNSEVSLKGFRAYFVTPEGSGAKACAWNLGDEATGINSVKANANADAEGKYIKNGRLVIVKNGKTYNANGAQIK